MDFSQRLSISYYKTIATLNELHNIFLVQHQETQKIYVKKVLDVYNKNIYLQLLQQHIFGTPQIIDICEENNRLVVIENYVSGCSLQEKINGNAISLEQVYRYLKELCCILEKMHSLKPPIIHRDIKPSNVIITEYDHVVLLDFNAAKYYSDTTNSDTVLLGTKGYAAPEQYGFGASTPRTDIYALGVLAKELANVVPFVPMELSEIIDKCIQINPNDRFQTAAELKAAIERLGHTSETSTKKPFSIRSLIFPGYRSLTPWKMLVASSAYFFIISASLSLESKNVYGPAVWLERIFFLSMLLFIVFGCFNYLDIQRYFPLCKHKSKILHYLGIIFMDTVVVIGLFIIMILIEIVFFQMTI